MSLCVSVDVIRLLLVAVYARMLFPVIIVYHHGDHLAMSGVYQQLDHFSLILGAVQKVARGTQKKICCKGGGGQKPISYFAVRLSHTHVKISKVIFEV